MGSQIDRVALRVLILTGVRPGELRKAEWSEINFDTGVWEIPAEKMKMRRPHIVPLSEQVIDLLKQIHSISGSYQYIFPSRTDYRKHISDMLGDNKELIIEGLTQVIQWGAKIIQMVVNSIKAVSKLVESTVGWKGAILGIITILAILKKSMIMAFIANPITWVIASIVGLMLLLDDLMGW